MTTLPPELEGFAALLDAQPGPAREAFQYCLCLMLVEAGKMKLADTHPGDSSPIRVFETVAGETFSIPRPPITEEQEDQIILVLRDILEDEGLL